MASAEQTTAAGVARQFARPAGFVGSLAGLIMAAQRQRPAESLICRSDRGSQYASEAYGNQIAAMKATPPMSRTACCYDNAPMKSFFHTLKVELVHQRGWANREDTRRDLFAYIEGYYNRRRIHSALGYKTPKQTEPQTPRSLTMKTQAAKIAVKFVAHRRTATRNRSRRPDLRPLSHAALGVAIRSARTAACYCSSCPPRATVAHRCLAILIAFRTFR